MDPPYVQLSDTEDEEIDVTLTAEDEMIDYENLKKRICKDRVLLQKMKEKLNMDESENREAKQEASRKKKMSRAQDSVLKYMIKMMEVCKARGFVYGIVPEKGKPVTRSSDSLREWWKEDIRFDQNAPAAIAKLDHESMCAFGGTTLDHQRSNSNNENSKAFHDYLSSEERMTSVGDWMNMEVAKANNNNNNNNNFGDTDFGDIDIMNGIKEIAGEAFGEDNLGLWLNDIEDCELLAALEMGKANSVMDSTHQNNNPPLIKHDYISPHHGLGQEATTSSL
ncbi:hypothetical protein Ahy_A09g046186 [Arachis hypogaea]|uniref:Ethylene insensitive 3-like DNA-binding domain-containing protein n=1 Tax=Arachis hypogaea TaxID=3818 RepID=A0A445BP54_ARAHY|nr:hypothetical protein Ahy_A09g046186 [Arachis hypogaea]